MSQITKDPKNPKDPKDPKDPESPEASLLPVREKWDDEDVRHIPVFIAVHALIRPVLTGRLRRHVQEALTELDVIWFFADGENEVKKKILYRLAHENLEVCRDAVKDVVSKWPLSVYARASESFSENDADLVKLHQRMTRYGGNAAQVVVGILFLAYALVGLFSVYPDAKKNESQFGANVVLILSCVFIVCSVVIIYEAVRVRADKMRAKKVFERLMMKGDE